MLSKKAKQSKNKPKWQTIATNTYTRFHYKNLKKWPEFAKRLWVAKLALNLNSKYKNFVKYVIDANSKRF